MNQNEINKKPDEPLNQSSIHTLESDLASAVMDNKYNKNSYRSFKKFNF
jgi:hypothetical protein